MFFGRVARNLIPDYADDQSEGCADDERNTPAVTQHNVSDERWRKSGANADTGEDEAVGESTFRAGDPPRDELIGCGVHDGFSHT